MTPADAFRVTSELLALRRVYAALAPVMFLDDERTAVDHAFRDRELWLTVALRELPPALLAEANVRLACGAPAIRPPAVDAPAPPVPELAAPPDRSTAIDALPRTIH